MLEAPRLALGYVTSGGKRAEELQSNWQKIEKQFGVNSIEAAKAYDEYDKYLDKMEELSKKEGMYKVVFLHDYICPQWALKEAQDWFFSFMKTDENGIPENVGFWAWGDQVFIPEKYFPYLQLISIKQIDPTKGPKEVIPHKLEPQQKRIKEVKEFDNE